MNAELKMLERMFCAEIEGRLFQSKAAMLKRLESQGLVASRERQEPTGLGTMLVKWWELTHAGRLLYCMSCTEPPDAAPMPTKEEK